MESYEIREIIFTPELFPVLAKLELPNYYKMLPPYPPKLRKVILKDFGFVGMIPYTITHLKNITLEYTQEFKISAKIMLLEVKKLSLRRFKQCWITKKLAF